MTREKQWGARYLVGWFLEEFAHLEVDMEQALGWLLGLPPQSTSILLRHLIVYRKIEALRLLIPLVLDDANSAARFDTDIKMAIKLNDGFRKEFAHAPFREQSQTGSIELLERFSPEPNGEPAVARVIAQKEVIAAIERIAHVRVTLHEVMEIMALKNLENMSVLYDLRKGRGIWTAQDHEVYSRLLTAISGR